jgi:hypothetical protein
MEKTPLLRPIGGQTCQLAYDYGKSLGLAFQVCNINGECTRDQ